MYKIPFCFFELLNYWNFIVILLFISFHIPRMHNSDYGYEKSENKQFRNYITQKDSSNSLLCGQVEYSFICALHHPRSRSPRSYILMNKDSHCIMSHSLQSIDIAMKYRSVKLLRQHLFEIPNLIISFGAY